MIRIWKAFIYSLEGLKSAWKDEAAFRQEVMLVSIALPLAYFLAPDRMSMMLMQASILLVLVVELLNTAIEAAINRMGSDYHLMSKKAKDCGSAAVFVALCIAALIWLSVLI